MKIAIQAQTKKSAFTLMEAICGMALMGTVVFSLYAGISSSFSIIEAARQNLRATQIIAERMEILRLLSWEQWNPPKFPLKFKDYYNFTNQTGVEFHGQVKVENATNCSGLSYNTNLLQITIEVKWTNNAPRTRSMTTLIAERGMQAYVY
jgi:hypothetical protein